MEINHVLIVEDDKEIREGVQIYLQSQGYVVFQAADGIEGLEILEKEEIHLAIIDIMMPRMDGRNTIFRLSCYLPNPRRSIRSQVLISGRMIM